MAIDIDDFRSVSSADALAAQVGSPDAELISKLCAGDEEAFENFVDRFSPDVYALLLRLTSNPNDAADLTQETFIQAFRGIEKFRGDANLKTWLFRIAINRSRNRFRWWKRRSMDKTISIDAPIGETEITIGETLADTGSDPEQISLSREREAALVRALTALKPIYREVVVLIDVKGLSYEECAAVTDENIGTIKSRLARGREELRKRLKDI